MRTLMRACARQGGLTLTSLDVPVLCTGRATPFISPRTSPPDMEQGVHWNVFQNIWQALATLRPRA